MVKERIFALDIGTRKIIGLVMEKYAEGYKVLDSEMIEHKTRAMLDGQIHDVVVIAETISTIKKRLEERMNMVFEKAAVAAAGRALKTSQGTVSKKRSVLTDIKPQEVRALEIEAVQAAQFKLAEEEKTRTDRNQYICAGYSVVYYALEGQKIVSLSGHVGMEIEVKIIATFLPRVVVDSLFSALKKAELDVYSLTLEPIAALSITIPESMRLLNLALVDIGAGTSDIAVIKENNVYGYAMVPMGGDKLTEAIATAYLLDFNQAEIVKKIASEQETVTILDILGNRMELEAAQIQEALHYQLLSLTEKIAEQILYLNQQVPDAVICVGGGSVTPKLTDILADKLNMVISRIGIKSADSCSDIAFASSFLSGPQGVTPLGIAYHAFETPPMPFIRVFVNERQVTLWNVGQINVGIALLNSGITLNNIYGRPGLGKTINVNGKVTIFKGSMGQPPVIKVNNENAGLENTIKDGDIIVFQQGQDGEDARVFLSDLINIGNGFVTVNGERIDLKPLITVNDREYYEHEGAEIEDRSKVEYRETNSLANVLLLAKVPEIALLSRHYEYSIDKKPYTLDWSPLTVKVNGKNMDLHDTVTSGAEITYTLASVYPRIKDAIKNYTPENIEVYVNDELLQVKTEAGPVMINGEIKSPEEALMTGAELTMKKTDEPAILSDIFRTINITPQNKGSLIIKVDGEEAGFTTPIKNRSQIELKWES